MNLKFLHKGDFHFDLFIKNTISNVYQQIKLSFTNTIVFENSKISLKNALNIYSFKLFPSYLKTTVQNGFVIRKVFQKSGFAINLNGYDSVSNYVSTHCRNSFKKGLNRSIKRLEACFDVSYKMYYGDISADDYQYLMQVLHTMLIKRFQQRNDNNEVLHDWDFYLNHSFDLINDKKASLFVISNGTEPIEISLNYHFDSIAYSHISSYSLDYAKFSLGNIEIYKQLEWCINNNIEIFDMGYGDFDYKRKWSNLIYDFNHNIVYHPKNIFGRFLELILKTKYVLINYLISIKVNVHYNNIKSYLKGNPNKSNYKPLEFKSETIEQTIDYDSIKYMQVDINNKEFDFLRKPLFDFLYTFQEHINTITVYRVSEDKKSFLFKGKNNTNKTTIN